MITIQVEKIKDIVEEMKPLLEKHYKEVHLFPDKIPFNPNYEKYFELEELGMTHTLTARHDEKLIGYIVGMIYPNLHYQDHLYVVNDVIYLDEAYRHTGLAYEMVKNAEMHYKELGASVMTFHMKVGIPFKALCDQVGLEHGENLYLKYIGD
jgi:GNAT superfamily N-acetyltransferase